MYKNKIITENEVVTVTEEFATMPDGVRLYTRYAVPRGVEKCPVVYMRTPYEKTHGGAPHDIEEYKNNTFIKRGYAVLLQHCRGRGDSEGECVPCVERADGLATLDFIRSLPFYNGEIFPYGGSYLSLVHLSYLDTKPHDVKGAYLFIQSDRKFFRNYQNGCNYKLNNLSWWCGMLDKRFPVQNREEMYKRPYVEAAKRVFGVDVPEYTNTLIHNTLDDFWTSSPAWGATWNAIDTLSIPTLFVEGWEDYYVDGMTEMWGRIPEETKKKCVMYIGPYGHGTSTTPRTEYPMENTALPVGHAADWFDSIREGKPYPHAEMGKITYYSMGGSYWRAVDYPCEAGAQKRFWLGKNGRILAERTEGEALSYTYDPTNAENPYRSGNIFRAHKVGTVDGILSFVSDPFEKEESFFGKIKLHLNVSSDCEDTAFFARVYLGEDGEDYNLTETVGSLSYLVGDYTPGTKVAIDFQTPPAAFTVKKGARVRVDISSVTSVYVPHANMKGHFAYVTETKVANNTVYTEGSYIDIAYEL